MPTTKKITERKKRFLEYLSEAGGARTTACSNMGIDYSTFRRWYNSDPEFAARVEDVNELRTDFVESKLMKRIEDGDTTAIIFYLKTQGRNRGWSSKQNAQQAPVNSPTTETEQLIESKMKWLQELMTQLGTYNEALTPQIRLAAILIVKVDSLLAETEQSRATLTQASREGDSREKINPAYKALLETAEKAQKSLKALGFGVLPGSPKGKEPFCEFMEKFDIDNYPDD